MKSRLLREVNEVMSQKDGKSSVQYEDDNSNNDNKYEEISNIPGYAIDAAMGLPSKILGIAKQIPNTADNIVRHPINSLRDVGGGIARGSQNLAATLGEGGQGIASLLTGGKAPRVNIREELGLDGKNNVNLGNMIETENPDPLLSGAGQYGLGAGAFGSKMAPFLSANILNAALQAPPGNRTKAGTEAAVNLMLPPIAIKGAIKGFNAARPSNILRGNLSPEELQDNLEAARGTNTNLGDVIGSPNIKRLYENVLPNVPLSGAYSTMQKTANQITKKGEDLMSKIGENLPAGDKTQVLQTALKDATKEATKEKNASFEKVNKIANDINLNVGRESFKSKAQEILNDINKSPELKREISPEILNDLKEYAKGEEGNNLKLSNIFRGKLGDKKNDLYISGKKYESSIMRDLHEALDSDIKTAIKGSKHPGLKTAYEEAQKDYGTKYKPFEHPDILKFTREGGDADLMLSHFLKTGANDRGELIQRLTTKLPKDLNRLPLYMYLSRAVEDGQLNPVKLNTLYGKLGEKQRNSLIPDKAMRKEIEKYTKSVGMNKEGFETMFNPKTGQRNLDSAVGVIETLIGHGLAGVPGALAAIPAMGILGRGATKLLTNEKIREALIKKMVKKK